MLSVGSEAIPRQMLTASLSLSWVMLHLSLLESTHSIKIKGKTISWLMFSSFDRFLSRLSGVTSPSGSTLSFPNHFLIRGQSRPFSVPHFVLGMPGLLRGLGQGKHSLPRVFAARNGEGKQGEYLEAVLSHAAVCFPPSSGPAPPQNHSRLGRLNSPPMAWWWRYKWDWKCPQEKEDTIKAFLSSYYSHHCIILHNRGDECPALGVLSLQTGCITPFQAREEFQSQNTGRKREEKGPFLL